MKTIWKYGIPLEDLFTLNLPKDAKFLSIQEQNEQMESWFLVDMQADLETRRFCVRGTGHFLDDQQGEVTYLGTVQQLSGALVWHLFEIEE